MNKTKLEKPVINKVAKTGLFMSAYESGEIIAQALVQGTVNTILLKRVLIINDLSIN